MDFGDLLDLTFKDADCYQFGSLLYERFRGYGLPYGGYSLDSKTSVGEFKSGHDGVFRDVERSELQALDGIIFTSPTTKYHMGFFIGKGKFIHMTEQSGVCIDRLDSNEWKHRIVGYKRYGN